MEMDVDNLCSLEIRPFHPTDQPDAKALILAGLADHWGTLDSTLNPDLNNIAASYAHGTFIVALLDGVLVGTGAIIPEAAGVARIVRMSVDSTRRRQGIGQALLNALIAAAQAQGYGQLVLETTATWADAIAFYTRCGFTAIGERDGDRHFTLDIT